MDLLLVQLLQAQKPARLYSSRLGQHSLLVVGSSIKAHNLLLVFSHSQLIIFKGIHFYMKLNNPSSFRAIRALNSSKSKLYSRATGTFNTSSAKFGHVNVQEVCARCNIILFKICSTERRRRNHITLI